MQPPNSVFHEWEVPPQDKGERFIVTLDQFCDIWKRKSLLELDNIGVNTKIFRARLNERLEQGILRGEAWRLTLLDFFGVIDPHSKEITRATAE